MFLILNKGSNWVTFWCHCIDSFCNNKVEFPFVCNTRIAHLSFSVLYFQFILVHKDCYLFVELIGLKLKDSLLSCIMPYFHLYWQSRIAFSILPFNYWIWLLFTESTLSLEVWWVVSHTNHWRPHCPKYIKKHYS